MHFSLNIQGMKLFIPVRGNIGETTKVVKKIFVITITCFPYLCAVILLYYCIFCVLSNDMLNVSIGTFA